MKIISQTSLLLLILTSINLFSQNDKITVYFNKWVDNNASPIVDAQRVIDINDTLIAYIDRAETSIDFCMYNNNLTQVVTALNNAYSRGVNVRYIYDDDASNSALSGLNSNINSIHNVSSGIMHNKFLVIDVETSEKTFLITGSVNSTYTNIFEDYNNLVIIQDNEIALTYKDEFNEMWGSTSLTPNTSNSKFGSYKSDNTQHIFNVNGTDIEVYFSPSDGVNSKIENTINSADNNLYFALLYFTRSDLADAVISKHNAGVEIKGLIEEIDEAWGSEYQNLLDNGVNVHSFLEEPGMLHHKYAIVDYNSSSSDPIVLTGSHNWSTSAETKNDENTLIIHDLYVANEFYEEFTSRFNQVSGINDLENLNDIVIKENSYSINISSVTPISTNIYDISGKLIKNNISGKNITISKNEFNSGIYLVEISNNKYSKTIKFVKN